MKKIVIVGGGISGLALAFRLLELREERQLSFDLKLIEKAPRFGGLIKTESHDGFLLEAGPDAFITDKPWALNLCRRLGLEKDLIPTREGERRSYILKRGTLHPVPEGFYLTIPRNLKGLFQTRLLSFWGKLRMLFDLSLNARSGTGDESVADFVRRHFGKEALTWIAQPMIAGIYAADLENLSIRAAMPRLYELESQYGSLIRGLKYHSVLKETEKASGARYSLFMTLKHGAGALVEALLRRLPEESRVSSAPVEFVKEASPWQLYGSDGEIREADVLCLAMPSFAAARILNLAAPDLSRSLSGIRYEPMTTVNLAYRRSAMPEWPGFGFVVPETEKKGILGCTFVHAKFDGRTPSRQEILLRAFVKRGPLNNLSNDSLTQSVHQILRDCLGLTENLLWSRIHRLERAMPQYEPGHLERIAGIERLCGRHPGLYLIGNAYYGVGLPDLIHQAENTAERILRNLKIYENQQRTVEAGIS